MQAKIQKFGGYLAAMVIPNIGAFIAWGLITALFIDVGWLAKLGVDYESNLAGIATALVGPMIQYLLPVLVAYTGGKMIHGHRGGVIGAIAVFGAIGSTAVVSFAEGIDDVTLQQPQFLGAMLIGPLAGWVLKQIDAYLEDKTPAGFEMLFNNFSQGIAGVLLALVGYWIVGPIMGGITTVFANIIEGIADAGLLPLADIPIEVAKVLFLNNAVNHGVLTGLGAIDVAENGRSIYFMLEANPGPGLGLLGSYWFAGKGLAKLSAPGAIVIHFFGGIHEVYFPYVLMNPVMIAAMWAGGITADIIFVATDAGLTGPPSPGSIFAFIAFLPTGFAAFGVLLGIAAGAVASFVTGSVLLRMFPVKDMTDNDDAMDAMEMPDIPGMASPA